MGPRYSNDSCAVSAHSPKAIAPFRMERLSPITEPLRQWPSRWSYATRMCVCREWERLSVQRGIKHPLAGLTGRALVTNIAEPLWPYLIVGQWVHVGKAASFGQGRYMVAHPARGKRRTGCQRQRGLL